jgi:hypothetical protein
MSIERERQKILDAVMRDIKETYNMLVECPSRDLIYKKLIEQNRDLRKEISKIQMEKTIVSFALDLAKSLDKDDYMMEETLSCQTINIIDDIKNYMFIYEQIYGKVEK